MKARRIGCIVSGGLGWGFIAALCGEREFLGLVSMRFFILVPLHLARRNGVICGGGASSSIFGGNTTNSM